MNLAELQKEAHAVAKKKGWCDQERTFGDCIARVHSELSEALEAYRGWPGLEDKDKTPVFAAFDFGIPHGVAYELADVVIRVADMAEWYHWSLSSDGGSPAPETFGGWIALAHYWLSQAYGERPQYRERNLINVVVVVYRMATHYDIDLDAAIATKMEYLRRTERC